MQGFDILFLAVVAVILVYRLYSVLGSRTGHQRDHSAAFTRNRDDAAGSTERSDNVIELPDRGRLSGSQGAAGPVDSDVNHGVADIREADPAFAPDMFLEGARGAFEMIVQAFAAGDLDPVRPFIGQTVQQQFDKAIADRTAAGETVETRIEGWTAVTIVGAELRGSEARVKVRFETEQINVVRDGENRIIDGDPNAAEPAVDIWTFARDTRSEDPNWQLVATHSVA